MIDGKPVQVSMMKKTTQNIRAKHDPLQMPLWSKLKECNPKHLPSIENMHFLQNTWLELYFGGFLMDHIWAPLLVVTLLCELARNWMKYLDNHHNCLSLCEFHGKNTLCTSWYSLWNENKTNNSLEKLNQLVKLPATMTSPMEDKMKSRKLGHDLVYKKYLKN